MPEPTSLSEIETRKRTILVSMVTYGGAERTRVTLDALLSAAEADGIDARAVVVDNHERYGTGDRDGIRAAWETADGRARCFDDRAAFDPERVPDALADGTRIAYVFADANLGFACGNILAVAYAGAPDYDYLLVATPDVRVETPGGLRALCDALDAAPDAGVVGPRVVDPSGRPQGPFRYQGPVARYGALLAAPLVRIVRGRYHLDDRAPRVARGYVYRLMGCFLLFRTADFVRAGGFDPRTFLFAEESIMAERLRAVGRRCLYEGGVTVRHETGTSIRATHDTVAVLRMRFASDMLYYSAYRRCAAPALFLARAGMSVFVRFWMPLARLFARRAPRAL